MKAKAVNAIMATVVLATTGALSPADALVQSACLAAQNGCVAKLAAGLLACRAKAETPGKKPVQPALGLCEGKAQNAFGGQGGFAKSCFGKLEAKRDADCLTTGDWALVLARIIVWECVADVAGSIDPDVIDRTKCGAAKTRCAGKKLRGLLACHAKHQKPGKPVDLEALQSCIADVQEAFDGGAMPANGCFAKLEAKAKHDCLEPIGNAAATEAAVDACVSSILTVLGDMPASTTTSASTTSSTSSTTSSSTTTTIPVPSGCVGDIPNGVVDPGEECDDSDPAAPFGCNRCVLCGNGIVTAPQERCDDGNLTSGDGCSDTCQNEVCGDGILTGVESCDDGNTTDFIPDDASSAQDNCPANCVIERCTPTGSAQVVTVNLGTSGIAGILVGVDYPEGKVAIPGSGPVDAFFTGLPTGVTAVSNDQDYGVIASIVKWPPFTTLQPGQLFQINFETCAGAPPVTANEFKCVVLAASNVTGTDVFGATCSVVVP